MSEDEQRDALAHAIDALEESYELFLAYAAQGARGDEAGAGDTRVRRALERASEALTDLAGGFESHLASQGTADRHRDFLDLLARDAAAARAAIDLVKAQPRISSQLVDNLNASVHLRALLTDLFLLDQILVLTEAAKEADSG